MVGAAQSSFTMALAQFDTVRRLLQMQPEKRAEEHIYGRRGLLQKDRRGRGHGRACTIFTPLQWHLGSLPRNLLQAPWNVSKGSPRKRAWQVLYISTPLQWHFGSLPRNIFTCTTDGFKRIDAEEGMAGLAQFLPRCSGTSAACRGTHLHAPWTASKGSPRKRAWQGLHCIYLVTVALWRWLCVSFDTVRRLLHLQLASAPRQGCSRHFHR